MTEVTTGTQLDAAMAPADSVPESPVAVNVKYVDPEGMAEMGATCATLADQAGTAAEGWAGTSAEAFTNTVVTHADHGMPGGTVQDCIGVMTGSRTANITNALPVKLLSLAQLRIDGGTQSRVSIDQSVIAEYADVLRAGDTLPAVVAFFDGVDFWLADGFHRYHAYAQVEALDIPAVVHTGVLDDALLYAAGANVTHGLRRTNADKRNAVKMVLAVPKCATWSDSQIAKTCGVSPTTVAAYRASLSNLESEAPTERTYTTKHGTTATMKTANIGKGRPAQEAPKPRPNVEPDPAPEVATPRPTPEQGAVAVVDVRDALSERDALREELADLADEVANLKAALAETLAENETMARIVNADNQVKAALDEVERYKAVAEQANRTLAARSQEFTERARNVVYWKNRAEKAEKQLDKEP